MARRRTRPQRAAAPPRLAQRVETGPDGYEYQVRPVAAARAVKTYRCPGCDHEIRSGTAHVVAWRADSAEAVQDRRHWHTPCWANRGNRGPTRKWS
ncbi:MULTISPECIES: hypothetical protein [Mycobacterium]|uniref:hypothetical protein n=1 Tax=Mycobacterium TaxID=1763 RepID=UPI001EEF877D|nr:MULTISPECIES: hypothetical protein [Mycobacterium]